MRKGAGLKEKSEGREKRIELWEVKGNEKEEEMFTAEEKER